MILQPRDVQFLKMLLRFGVMSTRQIRDEIFPGVAHTTVLRRLRALESKHYIRRGVTLEDGSQTWSVGSQAILHLGHGYKYSFTNRNEIRHDVLLTSLRLALQSIGLGSTWTSGFEIKTQRRRNQVRERRPSNVPDGILSEPIKGRVYNFAVELELTQKSIERYKKIFDQYRHKDIFRIWYFVKHLGIANVLDKIVTTGLRPIEPGRLWISTVGQFLSNPERANVFDCGSQEMIRLCDIGFTNFKQPLPAHTTSQGVSGSTEGKTSAAAQIFQKTNQGVKQKPSGEAGTVSAPDPTPPTSTSGGLGSGATTVESGEEGGEHELKKCG